jgi:pyruvate,orthophosphate dikinase
VRLWGDFTIGNQGEDVASGLVNTLPISIIQQDIEMRETDITLETHFHEIYSTLKKWAVELIHKHGWSPQEIEFTFESPSIKDLYILQARDMTIRERKQVWAFDPADTDSAQLLGHGIGVSGGAICGRIVFSLEEIDKWKKQDPESPVILVRSDTVPDDIKEIFAADGLLTSRGGVTSHAAVVAHRLGKTCVVGCEEMHCNEKDKECRFAHIRIKSGELISIDGREGSVYHGSICILRD